ncbi:META domain-containing protein [Neisseriaceae bacterium TC5R-5]|nr:META domain-containing protein [Neisseriaceae bacterium TC5R-5]
MKKSLWLVFFSSVALAACATLEYDNTISDLEGEWLQENANPPFKLTFQDGRINAKADCNTLFGGVSLVDGKLISQPLASTMMACEPAGMQRDQRFSTLLSGKPTVTLTDEHLVLDSGDSKLSFKRQP